MAEAKMTTNNISRKSYAPNNPLKNFLKFSIKSFPSRKHNAGHQLDQTPPGFWDQSECPCSALIFLSLKCKNTDSHDINVIGNKNRNIIGEKATNTKYSSLIKNPTIKIIKYAK
jgi:hypothetical protein